MRRLWIGLAAFVAVGALIVVVALGGGGSAAQPPPNHAEYETLYAICIRVSLPAHHPKCRAEALNGARTEARDLALFRKTAAQEPPPPRVVRFRPRPVPAGTPRCRPAQLRLSRGMWVSEKTQQHTFALALTNISGRACALDGYPRIALFDPHGRPLRFRYHDGGDQMLTNSRPEPVLLAAGGRGYFAINKNACVTFTTQIAASMRVVPPGDTSAVTASLRTEEYCRARDPGHLVDVTPIEPNANWVFFDTSERVTRRHDRR